MHVDAIFSAIGRFSVRFRWLMTLAWVIATIAAVAFLPSLSSVTQNDNTKFLPPNAPMEKALVLDAPFGGGNQVPIPVIVARAGSALTQQDLAAITALQANLAKVHNVKRVIPGAPTPATPAGQAVQVVAYVPEATSSSQPLIISMVSGLRGAITATALPAGLQAHVAGAYPVAADQAQATSGQGKEVQLLSALFIVVLLMLIFRSFSLAIVTLIPAFLSVMIAQPLVAEAASHNLISVSSIAELLIVVLVLGAGTDYGLFLVFRVREQLRLAGHEGGPADIAAAGGTGRALWNDLRRPRDPARTAVVESITRVGESITFSAATVIVAVLTLLAASFAFYADMGVPFAIAVAVTLVAALLLLPALLSIRLSLLAVKRTLFQAWFRKPKLIPWSIQGSGKAGVWGKVSARIVRYPVPTLLAGLVFFGSLSIGVIGYRAAGFGGGTSAPSGSDSARAAALMTTYYPNSAANPTVLIFRFGQPVWANAAELDTITARLRTSGQFTKISGPLNPVGTGFTPQQFTMLYQMLGSPRALPQAQPPSARGIQPGVYQLYRATGNLISADGRSVQYLVGLRAGDPGATPALNAVPAIRAATTSAANAAGATDSGVIGQAPALYDISNLSNNDLKKIIPIAILAIGLLLAIVLRSLVAPLYLIASVGVSYLAALGLSVILFVWIGNSGGLMFFMAFLMFIFLLALGEDYNILVMTRIREEAHKLPLREAVSKAISVTGTTVTSAGLVLAGSFLVLGFSGGGGGASGGTAGAQVKDMSIGLALGILMDTFLVRTLLVPSTVVLLGRWNWWPSKLTMDTPEPSQRDDEGPHSPAPTSAGRAS